MYLLPQKTDHFSLTQMMALFWGEDVFFCFLDKCSHVFSLVLDSAFQEN